MGSHPCYSAPGEDHDRHTLGPHAVKRTQADFGTDWSLAAIVLLTVADHLRVEKELELN